MWHTGIYAGKHIYTLKQTMSKTDILEIDYFIYCVMVTEYDQHTGFPDFLLIDMQ